MTQNSFGAPTRVVSAESANPDVTVTMSSEPASGGDLYYMGKHVAARACSSHVAAMHTKLTGLHQPLARLLPTTKRLNIADY